MNTQRNKTATQKFNTCFIILSKFAIFTSECPPFAYKAFRQERLSKQIVRLTWYAYGCGRRERQLLMSARSYRDLCHANHSQICHLE